MVGMRGTSTVTEKPQVIWERGSAYDLFVSLLVIHQPDDFGLRPSWAAGVRSRLPLPHRETLEQSQKFFYIPLNWIHSLPEPKDTQTALKMLKELPPEDRLPALVFTGHEDQEAKEFHEFLLSLDGKRRFTSRVENQIVEQYKNLHQPTKVMSRMFFNIWTDRKAFGEKITEALEAYIENFFLEEENRIIPALDQSLAEAQALFKDQQDIQTLLEKLSSGVSLDWVSEYDRVVLAPSFWSAPLVFSDRMPDNSRIILFGRRPKGMALVPGEQVSEDLLNGLKAMADPTRLRILKYLRKESCTPSELAKILRLRPPTVIHHLKTLRLAGFVRVRVSSNSERRYAAREDGIIETARLVHQFLLED